MTLKRTHNVGIVAADIDAAIEFFNELRLELEGRAPIEGDWADGVTGLRGMRVEIAMMRTPDGHGRLELSRLLAPPDKLVDELAKGRPMKEILGK
jgi:catechol 2,3-dioxygenase-like lactoylglutathione lyase family enzyme